MAVTWSPATPVAGDDITVSVTIDGIPCTSAELTITEVPTGSALATGLQLDEAGEPVLTFTADVAGDYVYSVQRFTEFPAVVSFDGGAEPHTVALDTETGTISVGASLTLPIVTTFGALTLTIVTDSSDVTAASLGGATTEKAVWAALDATVLTKLAAIVGEPIEDLGQTLPDAVGGMGIAIDAHFRDSTAHPTGGGYTIDSVNVYGESPPVSIDEAVNKLNKIRAAYLRHALNSTTSTQPWHNSSDDTKNLPIVAPAVTVGAATVLYADMWRCYEAHRVQTASPPSHVASDVTNDLAAAGPLTDLLATILGHLADETPTVPAGVNPAQLQAVSLYGFQA